MVKVLSTEIITIGEWSLDPANNLISNGLDEIKLEKRLVHVLIFFAAHPQSVITKQQLFDSVWKGKVVSDDTLFVAISKLRKTLGCDAKAPKYIETVQGNGFKLIAPVSRSALPTKSPDYLGTIDEAQLNTAVRAEAPSPQASISKNTNRLIVTLCSVFIVVAIGLSGLYFLKQQQVKNKAQLGNLALNDDRYLKSRYLLNQDNVQDFKTAETLLHELHQIYPKVAEVSLQLARATYYQAYYAEEPERSDSFTSAIVLLKNALQLNPSLSDSHLQLARIYTDYQRDFTQAAYHYEQSIALNPSDLNAHLRYAELALATRDFDKAIHHNKIAQNLDPNFYASASIAWIYNMSGQYEEAQKELAKLYALDPDALLYHSSAIRLYENLGDEQRAFKHYLMAFSLAGYSDQELLTARQQFQQGGLKTLNYWLANVKKEQADIGQYLPPISTARYYLAAEDYEQALDQLELASQQKNYLMLWITSDPKYRPLYSSSRFQYLVKEWGLHLSE